MKNYDDLEGVRQSELKLILKSPRHFLERTGLGTRTKALSLGSLFHALVLEGEPVALSRFYVEPDEIEGEPINKRLKAHREFLENLAVECAGKEAVTKDQWDTAKLMQARIESNKDAMELLKGKAEIFMQGEMDGVMVKGQADLLNIEKSYVVDLKTTSKSASPDVMPGVTKSFGYDFQAAFYTRLFGVKKFYMIAIDSKPPHSMGIYDMCNWLPTGDALVTKALDRFKNLGNLNSLDYTSGIEVLSNYAYQTNEEEEGESEHGN